ncbi:hypothetical protein J6590_004053 [Homalodisca vitripennis]|nr:hypothetical protein J6590_004053 [Homalodisca vitripennis]
MSNYILKDSPLPATDHLGTKIATENRTVNWRPPRRAVLPTDLTGLPQSKKCYYHPLQGEEHQDNASNVGSPSQNTKDRLMHGATAISPRAFSSLGGTRIDTGPLPVLRRSTTEGKHCLNGVYTAAACSIVYRCDTTTHLQLSLPLFTKLVEDLDIVPSSQPQPVPNRELATFINFLQPPPVN